MVRMYPHGRDILGLSLETTHDSSHAQCGGLRDNVTIFPRNVVRGVIVSITLHAPRVSDVEDRFLRSIRDFAENALPCVVRNIKFGQQTECLAAVSNSLPLRKQSPHLRKTNRIGEERREKPSSKHKMRKRALMARMRLQSRPDGSAHLQDRFRYHTRPLGIA